MISFAKKESLSVRIANVKLLNYSSLVYVWLFVHLASLSITL